ncbi:efflux RND transporter permease subunit [Candidatus Woesebacteria bacterium]|nr:efflux RND transporter permease subunit [Candidatus Woesebacteria bacterium]
MKSYLDQLQFEDRLRNSFIAKYLTNIRLVALLIMSIIVLGVASYIWLPRRLNPEVNIPIVVVSTVLPGAGPEDVESLVTIPLENQIKNADGIDIMSSTSNENVSNITLQFKSSVDVDEARDEVQRLVNNANDLPADATTPRVQSLDFEDVPVWQFALTSSADQATLETIATQLEQEIETVSNVDRVEVSGVEGKEIQITVDPTTIAELGVNPQQLASAITDATSALPAGNITTQQTDFAVSINPAVDTLDTLRNTPIQVNQQVMQLQDIATVQYRSAPYQSRSYLARPDGEIETAVSFAVYKTSGSDIESTQQAVEERVTTWLTPYDETIHLVTLENVAKEISDQFADLGSNFASTIVLVFLTLLVFLGIRQATIASLSIPMTFLVSFFIMNITGQTLNFLTMFSLLLALGLLVDDAIVIVQSMTAYSRTGRFSAEETGLLVWRDFIVPIWTTTITTVWAFVPLLLATGIIGEFIKSIPIVVSSTLLTSTAVAVLITLPMMIILLDVKVPKRVRTLGWILLALGAVGSIFGLTQAYAAPALPVIAVLTILLLIIAWRWRSDLLNSVHTSAKTVSASPWYTRTMQTLDTGLINLQPAVDRYQNFMNSVLENKTSKRQVIAAVVIFSIFSYLLVPLGFVQNEFFPETDSDIMYVAVELPSGSNRELTETKT